MSQMAYKRFDAERLERMPFYEKNADGCVIKEPVTVETVLIDDAFQSFNPSLTVSHKV